MDRERHITDELDQRLRTWSVRAARLGAAVFLAVAPLDFVAYPAAAPRFLLYRVVVAAFLLGVGALAGRLADPRHIRWLVLGAVLVSAVSVELMVLDTEGYRSPYAVGMVLLAVTAIGVIPAGWRLHALLAASVHLVYAVPFLPVAGVEHPRFFFAQNYLFVSVSAVMIVVRHLHRRSTVRMIGLAFDLSGKERLLEEQVRERTAALVRASDEWRAAFDAAGDLFVVVDAGDVVVRANRAASRFVGERPREIVGWPLQNLLAAGDLRDALPVLGEMRRRGARAEGEVFCARRDSWFLVSAEPAAEGSALEGGAVLTFRDISMLKVMETAVVQARDDWEETFDSIQEGIMLLDDNHVILRANRAARIMLGDVNGPLEGRRCHEICHGTEAPIGGCPCRETLRTGRTATVDYFEPALDRYLEVTTLPRPGGGVIHVMHDIAERKSAMDEQLEATARIQGILERSPFGVFVVDEAFRVEFANASMLRISGYPREEFVGAFLGSFPGCTEIAMAPRIERALEGTPFRFGPAEYRCRDRERTVIGQFVGVPLTEKGRPKVLVFVEDVTELKAAEREQQRLNAMLLQAQKMEAIGTLASGLAHDFNNILLAVIGLTDAALERLGPGNPAREDLESVIGAAERGSHLVNQLLAFGRRQELAMRPVDLAELVEESRRLLVPLLPRTVEIGVHLSGEPPTVIADPVQIGRVLMNLAVNARDAMPDGGRITLSVGTASVSADDPAHPGIASGSYALLAVCDTGVGIPPVLQERIFEPFFSTKGAGTGAGLGLATVYGVAAQHGGAVRVSSEPGEGTAFVVYLPLADAGAHVAPPPGAGPGETILYVDDDAMARHVIGRRLAALGYSVLEAADGSQAGALLGGASRLDALLCDVVLPGKPAREVARDVLARFPSARVVFVSGHPEPLLAERGLLAAGDLLVHKSLGPDGIARRVREALDAPAVL